MKSVTSFRIENSVIDSLDKIKIKEKISKTEAFDKILKLGLEVYFNENKPSESEKIEKKLSPKFDELQEKIQELSTQIKDVDLKSYRMNVFLTDFANIFFDKPDKFKVLNQGINTQMENYKINVKHIPKLGFIVLKYIQNILNKNPSDEFYSEIERSYSEMINKK